MRKTKLRWVAHRSLRPRAWVGCQNAGDTPLLRGSLLVDIRTTTTLILGQADTFATGPIKHLWTNAPRPHAEESRTDVDREAHLADPQAIRAHQLVRNRLRVRAHREPLQAETRHIREVDPGRLRNVRLVRPLRRDIRARRCRQRGQEDESGNNRAPVQQHAKSEGPGTEATARAQRGSDVKPRGTHPACAGGCTGPAGEGVVVGRG